jgi:hypothetical protein
MHVCAGSGMLVRSIPYQTAPSAKQAAWLLHCAVLGAVIAPICLLGENKSSPVLWTKNQCWGSGAARVLASGPPDPFLFS